MWKCHATKTDQCVVRSDVIKMTSCFESILNSVQCATLDILKNILYKNGVLAENYFSFPIMQRYCYSSRYFNTHYAQLHAGVQSQKTCKKFVHQLTNGISFHTYRPRSIYVRYVTILTWLRGFQNKIANLLSFFCPSRESDALSKNTNMLKRNLLYLSASRFNIMIASNSKIADWSYKWLVFFKIGLIW